MLATVLTSVITGFLGITTSSAPPMRVIKKSTAEESPVVTARLIRVQRRA